MWDSRVMKYGLRLGFNGQFDDFDDFDDKGWLVLIIVVVFLYEVEYCIWVCKYLILMVFWVFVFILVVIVYGVWYNGLILLLIVVVLVLLLWMVVLIVND